MDYDIFIVGAGLVGSSLAMALAKTPLRIALCEAIPLKTSLDQFTENRFLALTYGSSRILQALGLELQGTPIHTVHVSHRGHLGVTRIHAREEQVPALGYVIPSSVLGFELNKAVLALPNLALFNPVSVKALIKIKDGWQVELENKTLTASLVIAADGTNSALRQLLNIAVEEREYDQSAIVTTVTLNRSHQHIAYERFTENGALALLPLSEQKCALIWTAPNGEIETLLKLSDNEFLQQTQEHFGYRLGKFLQITSRSCYPLKFLQVKEQIREGFILMGNAAHTLHPIAAQGFNLSLSDVACLVKIIKEGNSLQEYDKISRDNQQQIIRFTDYLITYFSHDFLPFNMARGGGLLVLDMMPFLKRRLAKKLMGFNDFAYAS